MRVVERGDLLGDLDGATVALEALLGDLALGAQPLRLAGLLEEGAALGERPVRRTWLPR